MINTEDWHLNEIEYGKVCENSQTKRLKIWMPKVIPFIKYGKPKTKLVPINKGCLINDEKCKPKISSKVKTANYITIPNDDVLNGAKVKKGTRVNIKVKNHSPDQMAITHDIL